MVAMQSRNDSRNELAPAPWQLDPARVKRIAVLCGPVVVLLDHSSADSDEYSVVNVAGVTLDTLIEQVIAAGCGALWLLPVGGAEPRGGYDAPWLVNWEHAVRAEVAIPQMVPEYPLRLHELSQRNRIAGLVAQRVRGGMPVGIYAAWMDQWNVAGVLPTLPTEPMQRARAFAYGVRLAAFALGAQLRFSPSYTGLQLLRDTLGRKPYAVPELSEWARDLIHEHRPTYVQWCRAVNAREQFDWQRQDESIRLYKYDRNSSFVASAGEVPCGDPQPTNAFQDKCPGFYRVRVMAPPIGWPSAVPGPFHFGEGAGEYPNQPDFGAETWAWEPALRLAHQLGWHFDCIDGWYWPRGREAGQVHDVFRLWRERVWDARQATALAAEAPGAVAKAIVKRVGVATIGRLLQQRGRAMMRMSEAAARELSVLSHEVDDWGELSGMVEVEAPLGRVDLAQPQWWSTIIANASERVLSALYGHLTSVPVAAYVDAVYSLGQWPPEDIEPARLGKWKLERMQALTPGDLEQLNALASDPVREGAYSWVAQLAQFDGLDDDA